MSEQTLVNAPEIFELARIIERVVERDCDEHATTAAVADALRPLLAAGLHLDTTYLQPASDRYVMYPLWVDARGRFSIASAVWNVGQITPIHDHGTWGVIGIYQGIEYEERFKLPPALNAGPLLRVGEDQHAPGEVVVCCTSDQDIHRVACASDIPCVGVHVYGGDIGVLERRAYDEQTGAVRTFVSHWSPPARS